MFDISFLESNSFKADILNALDKELPDAGTTRLEARSCYVARIVDAINAALSKHDQVFIPASTRLGRVRALAPTCVACDRPLTTKGRRPDVVEKSKGTASGKDIVLSCRHRQCIT